MWYRAITLYRRATVDDDRGSRFVKYITTWRISKPRKKKRKRRNLRSSPVALRPKRRHPSANSALFGPTIPRSTRRRRRIQRGAAVLLLGVALVFGREDVSSAAERERERHQKHNKRAGFISPTKTTTMKTMRKTYGETEALSAKRTRTSANTRRRKRRRKLPKT